MMGLGKLALAGGAGYLAGKNKGKGSSDNKKNSIQQAKEGGGATGKASLDSVRQTSLTGNTQRKKIGDMI
jgi:hypothetical protein